MIKVHFKSIAEILIVTSLTKLTISLALFTKYIGAGEMVHWAKGVRVTTESYPLTSHFLVCFIAHMPSQPPHVFYDTHAPTH